MSFDKWMQLYKHCHNEDLEHFHYPEKSHHALVFVPIVSFPTRPCEWNYTEYHLLCLALSFRVL